MEAEISKQQVKLQNLDDLVLDISKSALLSLEFKCLVSSVAANSCEIYKSKEETKKCQDFFKSRDKTDKSKHLANFVSNLWLKESIKAVRASKDEIMHRQLLESGLRFIRSAFVIDNTKKLTVLKEKQNIDWQILVDHILKLSKNTPLGEAATATKEHFLSFLSAATKPEDTVALPPLRKTSIKDIDAKKREERMAKLKRTVQATSIRRTSSTASKGESSSQIASSWGHTPTTAPSPAPGATWGKSPAAAPASAGTWGQSSAPAPAPSATWGKPPVAAPAPASTWGEPSIATNVPAPSSTWGESPATTSSAPATWGQPAVTAPAPTTWGEPSAAAPAPSTWGQPQASVAAPASTWGQPQASAPAPASTWGQPPASAPAPPATWGQPPASAPAPPATWGQPPASAPAPAASWGQSSTTSSASTSAWGNSGQIPDPPRIVNPKLVGKEWAKRPGGRFLPNDSMSKDFSRNDPTSTYGPSSGSQSSQGPPSSTTATHGYSRPDPSEPHAASSSTYDQRSAWSGGSGWTSTQSSTSDVGGARGSGAWGNSSSNNVATSHDNQTDAGGGSYGPESSSQQDDYDDYRKRRQESSNGNGNKRPRNDRNFVAQDSNPPTGAGRGRGRGQTLPAWMTQGQDNQDSGDVPSSYNDRPSGMESRSFDNRPSRDSSGRGRGRGRDVNIPAWMTGGGDGPQASTSSRHEQAPPPLSSAPAGGGFADPGPGGSGRGRGRTLPAWMTQNNNNSGSV